MNIQKSTIPCLCLSPYLIQIPICTTPSHTPLKWRHLWIPQTPAHKTSSRAASNFFPLNTPHLRSFPVIYKRVEARRLRIPERERKNFYHFLFTTLKMCFDGQFDLKNRGKNSIYFRHFFPTLNLPYSRHWPTRFLFKKPQI